MLASDVQRRPSEYIPHAEKFGDLDPAYARNLIAGIRASLASTPALDLEPVLKLAARIVEGRVSAPVRQPSPFQDVGDDPDWTFCRREIAHFLESICTADYLGEDHEGLTWSCIARLLEDSDPTVEDEARFGASMGAANYSLNYVRGQTTHAAVSFLGHLKRKERIDSDAAAAAKAALSRHAGGAEEPSTAIRAAIGWHFQQLVACDDGWAEHLAPRLFSDDQPGRAASSALLTFTSAHHRVVDMLWPVLERAVHSEEWREDKESLSRSLDLVTALYTLDYRAPGDLMELVRTAWNGASVEVRSHAMIALANLVSRAPTPSPTALRAAEVMDSVLAVEESRPDHNGTQTKGLDLEAVGYVLATGHFPIEWTLQSLRRILTLGALPLDPENVVKLLVQALLRADLQDQTLECVRQLVDLGRDNWAVYASRTSIATIITIGRQSADEGVRRRTEALEEPGDVEGAKAAYQRAIASGHADQVPKAARHLEQLLKSTPPPDAS